MLEWSDFEVVVAIQESGTITAAARRLGLNQSTVSRILKKIEASGARPIFRNTEGTYALTPEGRAYYRAGKAMERAVGALGRAPAVDSIRGTVRLSTVEAMVGYLLIRLEGFRREHPGISIELHGSNRDVSLPKREFHAAIRLEREAGATSILAKKIGELGIAGYRPRATSDAEWLGYESSLAGIPEEKWLRARKPIVTPSLRVSSYVTMEKAIAQGLGRGLLPCFLGDRNPALRRETGDRPVLLRPIWFLTHPDLRQGPALRAFSAWAFRQFVQDRAFLSGTASTWD